MQTPNFANIPSVSFNGFNFIKTTIANCIATLVNVTRLASLSKICVMVLQGYYIIIPVEAILKSNYVLQYITMLRYVYCRQYNISNR